MQNTLYEEFEALCSLTENELKTYLIETFKKNGKKLEKREGALFYKGSYPVLLVAHLDTVFNTPPASTEYIEPDFMISTDAEVGLGGDDRCGIYIILNLLKTFDCSVLFTEDEEIGCVGVRLFCHYEEELCEAIGKSNNAIIQIDRRGTSDMVFYECANKNFKEICLEDSYYHEERGTFTDITVLGPTLNLSTVNISAGYLNEHTTQETILLKEIPIIITHLADLIRRLKSKCFRWEGVDMWKREDVWAPKRYISFDWDDDEEEE